MPETLVHCSVCGSDDLRIVDSDISLCRCLRCSLIFRNPRPSESEISAYYSQEDQYDDWLAHEHSRDLLWRRRLQMVDRYGRRGPLLDVGTGIGQFLSFAKHK